MTELIYYKIVRTACAVCLGCACIAYTTGACAVPIFYLSKSNTPTATPSNLDLFQAPGGSGTLYIWGHSSDVHVSGIGFDLLSSSNFLKFTSVTGPTAGTNWDLLSSPKISADGLSVTGFDAGALPPNATGFGAGTSQPDLLLGSVTYQNGGYGFSNLSMRIDDAGFAEGGFDPHGIATVTPIKFGSAAGALLPGDDTGAVGEVGSIAAGGQGVVAGTRIDNVIANSPGFVEFKSRAYPSPGAAVSWYAPQLSSYHAPGSQAGTQPQGSITPATFDPSTQLFHWSTVGAAPGEYNWSIGAFIGVEPAPASVIVNITAVPEPSASAVSVVTLLGIVAIHRRRPTSHNRV
jgi:hypothetical protein